MTKLLKSLSARFLFLDRGIVPTKRLLIGYISISICITLFTFIGFSWLQVFMINGLILLASLLDLRSIPKRSDIQVTRSIPANLERGLNYIVNLQVQNNSNLSCHIQLIDGMPQSFISNFPIEGVVPGRGTVELTYPIIAPVRGKYLLEKMFIRYQSSLGLWQKQMAVQVSDAIRVIPDLSETKRYLEDAQHFLMHEGMKIRKQKSGVGEFAQIRNYVVGDDPRKINWRQTAKLQTVMTNQYEPEHGKHVMILIDCGRTMGEELRHTNRLEKAIEASLTVAAAALGNGDYVGIIAFSKEVTVFVPPDKGMAQLQKILDAVYDLKVDAAESNYLQAMNYLQTVQKKRGLILLFSDIQAFLQEEQTLFYFEGIKRRHMFMLVTIEDELLVNRARQDPTSLNRAMVKGIAQEQIMHRKRQKTKWEKQGFILVEAKEDRLATAAVSHYIHIMNQGLL
ncbi:DUF58 domain-containing protein [Ornithinibacillus bavariensis]|uniref:DUF58 domain-containing protein n=1 Tax=Ornithinibacillus bavariensis TaxID=545502 RepID=UPI000EC21A79|nr:DUF58 domain-containing protein [Ornithinibacillus sp.]